MLLHVVSVCTHCPTSRSLRFGTTLTMRPVSRPSSAAQVATLVRRAVEACRANGTVIEKETRNKSVSEISIIYAIYASLVRWRWREASSGCLLPGWRWQEGWEAWSRTNGQSSPNLCRTSCVSYLIHLSSEESPRWKSELSKRNGWMQSRYIAPPSNVDCNKTNNCWPDHGILIHTPRIVNWNHDMAASWRTRPQSAAATKLASQAWDVSWFMIERF